MPIKVDAIQIKDIDASQLLIGNVGSRWNDVYTEVELAYSRLQEAIGSTEFALTGNQFYSSPYTRNLDCK